MKSANFCLRGNIKAESFGFVVAEACNVMNNNSWINNTLRNIIVLSGIGLIPNLIGPPIGLTPHHISQDGALGPAEY